jgi:hypothetical protein
MTWVQILQLVGAVLLVVVLAYLVWKFYSTRADFTYMTHNDQGFKRALKGRGFIIDPEEFVVRGDSAPRIEFVALDPATGERKLQPLLSRQTGAINLRPQYCVPLPFTAVTADNHTVIVEARVQFSLSRERMFFVYHVQDFGLALETRIQSAVRAEVGRRQDQDLRATLHEVEEQAILRLRKAETDGDETHEPGMALGVNFHTMSFTFAAPDEFAGPHAIAAAPGAVGVPATTPAGGVSTLGMAMRGGPLSLRPQQIDQLADVFRNQTPESGAAILAMLDMQTRQNIAEALASSGQLIVVTPQELGLAGATVQGQILSRVASAGDKGGAS